MRTRVEEGSTYRSIVFLCQECHGDLEPKPVAGQFQCRYECQNCRLLWVYGGAGWERVPATHTHVGTGAPPIDADL